MLQMLLIFSFFEPFIVVVARGDCSSIFPVWDFYFFSDSAVEIFALIFLELLVLHFSSIEKQGLEVRI